MKKIYTLLACGVIAGSLLAQSSMPKPKSTVLGTKTMASHAIKPTSGPAPVDTLNWDHCFGPNVTNWGNLGGGYIFGTNVLIAGPPPVGGSILVQGYSNTSSLTVQQVLIMFSKKQYVSNNAASKMSVGVWSLAANKATGGAIAHDMTGPNALKEAKDLLFTAADTTFGNFTVVTLDSVVAVTGDFGCGIDFSNLYTNKDTIGVWADANGSACDPEYNWFKVGSTWYGIDSIYGGQVSCNAAIFPVMGPTNGINELSFINSMKMSQNYPNPATTSTTLSYELAKNANNLSLTIVDLAGRIISEIKVGAKDSGKHTLDISTANLASGQYFFILKSDLGALTQKFTVSK
jgi:hypothetical protein